VRRLQTTAAGYDVVLTEAGERGRPAFVLVHGIGMSHRYYRPFTETLARDCHVLVPDLPGFGRSPRPARAPGVAEQADLVAALVESAGLVAPVLVGHSMGCQVVTEVLARHPGAGGAGVLIGPVVDEEARSPLRQAARLLRDGLHEPLRVNALITADYTRCGPRWYAATLPHMLGYRTEERIRDTAAPVLVVRGVKDPIAPAGWVQRLAAAAPRGSWAEVPDAGHVAMYVEPDRVKALCLAVRC
jgi:pimeloyl-ACP methyl ester carboxylesterase